MRKKSSLLRRLVRATKATCWGLFIIFVGGTFYASTVGFPAPLTRKILESVNSGSFIMELERLRLRLPNKVVCDNIKLYRKGVVGPPIIDAEKALVSLVLFSGGERSLWLRSLTLENATLCTPMAMHGKDEAHPEPGLPLDLHVNLVDSVVDGADVQQAACKLTQEGHVIIIKDVDVTLSGDDGAFWGDVRYNRLTSDLSGSVEMKLIPDAMQSTLRMHGFTGLSRTLRRFGFRDDCMDADLSIKALLADESTWNVEGQVTLPECTYRGVKILYGKCDMSYAYSATNSLLTIAHATAFRDEGVMRAHLVYNFTQDALSFVAHSTADPKAVAQIIGPTVHGVISHFDFNGSSSISGEGMIHFSEPSKNRADFIVRGTKIGMAPVITDECSFNASIMGEIYSIYNVKGALHAGTVEGSARFFPDPASSNMSYHVAATVSAVDLRKLIGQIRSAESEDYEGKVSGRIELTGLLVEDLLGTTEGSGKISISDGKLYRIPLFGGLSELLTKIVPGLDFVLHQTDARAEFRINNGRVRIGSGDSHIEGRVFSLTGRGSYYFDQRLDFYVQAKLLKSHTIAGKIFGKIVWPISKLFEFRLKGTVSAPEWYLINFSSDLLKKLNIFAKKSPDELPSDDDKADEKE